MQFLRYVASKLSFHSILHLILPILTHWGRATHLCVSDQTIIGSDNGLSPGRRQAIIWTITGILLIGLMGLDFSGILIKINAFSFKKMHLKMSSANWRLFRLGLNVLNGASNPASPEPQPLTSDNMRTKICTKNNKTYDFYICYNVHAYNRKLFNNV